MNKIMVAVASCVAIAAAGVAAWQTGYVERFTDTSHGAIAACEEGLKRTLRSRSSYKRIAAQYTPAEPLTLSEYADYRGTKGCPTGDLDYDFCVRMNKDATRYGSTTDWKNSDLTKQVRRPSAKAEKEYLEHIYSLHQAQPLHERQTAFVKIEYDAVNAYNTPIRSEHVCRFGPIGAGKFDRSDMFDQSLDGQSPSDSVD